MLEEKLEKDIKSSLLSGNSFRTTTLRGLKANLLNLKVATGKRETGLSDDEVIEVFVKEAKKRQESAELYTQGGNQARADAELSEKAIIEKYLPKQLSEEEVIPIVDKIFAAAGEAGPHDMGRLIGEVRTQTNGAADGAMIARLVKERLAS